MCRVEEKQIQEWGLMAQSIVCQGDSEEPAKETKG